METGKKVARACIERVARINLEMGGKDPFIVCSDVADGIETAAKGGAWAAFLNAGQVCTSAERFYVMNDVYDDYLNAFVDYTKGLVIGDPLQSGTDIGPMVSAPQRQKVADQVEAAVAAGAEVVVGGDAGGQSNGHFFAPAVVTGAPRETDLLREETFGPVAPLVPVTDLDEAIELANSTPFGLGRQHLHPGLQDDPALHARGQGGHRLVQRPAHRQRRGPVRRLQAVGSGPRARPRGPRGLPGDQARPHRERAGAQGMVVPLLRVRRRPAGVTDQSQAPYLDAILGYVGRDPARLHVPGHKGGIGADPQLLEALGEKALELDVPGGLPGIEVPPPDPTPFEQAQQLAADAWGAKRSWFLVNGGSGGNHAICLALAHSDVSLPSGEGPRLVVQRNVHSSIIDGMVLSGARPRFAQPELDPELGIAHCVTPDGLAEALEAEPEAVAAIVVSPTYFGAVADIGGLVEVAHARAVPLVVDEAWGSHLYFHDSLPAGALSFGADLVLTSIHKIVGSLTQSAILHLGSDELVDAEVVDRSVTLIESTSPSALLTASLDATRRMAATRGQELLDGDARAPSSGPAPRSGRSTGLDVVDERMTEHPSVHGYDPMRLAVDVRGTGRDRPSDRRPDARQDDINLEMFTENMVVAAFGMGERAAPEAERLVAALRHATERVSADTEQRRPFAEPPPWGPLERSPRQAFLGPQEVVPFDQAEGRIAAESLAAYPPGVPNVLPGERLTGPTLTYIADSIAHGGQVRGASDRSLRTVRVVRE